jgi:hypothetical protein
MRQPVDPAVECSPIPGEMSRLIADKDWSLTPLGPPAAWPLSLRTAVNIALASDGPGMGARFTVRIPLDQREVVVPL